jgi:putative thioredoxin
MAQHVIDVAEADFVSSVLDESTTRPVVVDFWAEWCGPCKVLGPTLERLATEGQGAWLLAKVDVDQNQALARQFGVQGIPTVVAFRDGQAVNRFTGALPEAQVREFIGSLVPSELDILAIGAEAALDRGEVAAAEDAFRSILARDPSHEAAGLGLSSILLDRNEGAEAIAVLARLARSDDVKRMEAAARLWGERRDVAELARLAETGDAAARLAYAKALSVDGDIATALEMLVELVAERGEQAEDARASMLDLFEILGNGHALVSEFRRRLASALF